MISVKGTVGKITILDLARVHIARQFMGIRVYGMDVRFVSYFMQSVIDRIKKASKGLIPGIERDDVLHLIMPLPPFAEQKRIVERLDKLLAVCDELK